MADLTISQAMERYLAAIERPEEVRGPLSAFVRWYGGERLLKELRGPDIARYVEGLGMGDDAQRRAQALRDFLSFLRREGLVSHNLAQHVRLRRAPQRGGGIPASDLPPIELTPEGYAALQAELEALKVQRPLIAEEIRRAALDKDFRENAPLQAARERQSHIETRIRELESLLRRAVVVEAKEKTRVTVGSTVQVRNLDDGRLLRYTIVGPGEADPRAGRISHSSPIGRALVDRAPGEEVEVEVPAGRLRLRVEHVE